MEKQKNKAKREHPEKSKQKSIAREQFEYYSKFLIGSFFYMLVVFMVYFFFNDLPIEGFSIDPIMYWMIIPPVIVLALAEFLPGSPRGRLNFPGRLTSAVIVLLAFGLLCLFSWIVGYLQ